MKLAGTVLQRLKVLGVPFKALNRDLKLIFVSNIIGSFGDGLYSFLLPVYIRTALGASPVNVGLLYAVMILAATVTTFLGGFLADRYDRKRIIFLSWTAWLPVPLIFSYASHWTQLFPAMAVYGCMVSTPAVNAYIASVTSRRKVTSTFTTISAAWWGGYIFSPTIGGLLYKIRGMKILFYLAFVFYAMAMVVLLFIRSQRVNLRNAQSQGSDRKDMIRWVIFFAVIMFFNFLIRPFTPTFLKDAYGFDTFQIGVLGSFSFAGSASLGLLIGKIGDRWGNMRAVSICMSMMAVSIGLLINVNDFFMLVPIFFMMGVNFIPWALMNAAMGSTAPESIRGKWIGAAQTASLFAAFMAPYVGGVLYEISPRAPFTVTLIESLALFAFTLAISSKRRWK